VPDRGQVDRPHPLVVCFALWHDAEFRSGKARRAIHSAVEYAYARRVLTLVRA
jgi:hypothetical protein